jgi:hypothetical protein
MVSTDAGEDTMKLCKRCSTEKPEAEFPKDRSKADGLNAYCKACAKAHTKAMLMRPPRRTPPDGMKWCGMCKQDLPLGEFHKSTRTYDGLHKACKACAAANHDRWRRKNLGYVSQKQRERAAAHPGRMMEYARKHHYGMAPGTYDAMLKAQGGRCAICGTDDPSPRRHFSVDHCHDTNKVRALLCGPCNAGIGSLQHDESILLWAIEYLRHHRK